MKMLEGIRIVDLTTVIFGPYATQMLADMGAEVIKVEAPGGDASRYLGRYRTTADMGSCHMTVNRGKRSIVLDLKTEEDAAVMRSLIATADIFVHNVRKQAIAKLGFDYDQVKAIKPDIIYMHGTGYGQNGPYGDLQAYDDVIQAATGTTSLLPRVDGNPRPRYLPSLIADKVAGHYGAQAMLAGLVHRLRTGEGQHIEVPMFEAFTNFMMTEHLRDGVFDPPLGPLGYPRQIDPGRQPFPASDGYLAIVPYTDAKMQLFLSILGASDLLQRDEFSTPLKRFQNLTALQEEIALLTPQKSVAEWLSICAEQDIPAAVARDLEDVLNDPHLKETDFFKMRDHPDSGRFREMRPPIRFSADPDRELGFAPRLNEQGDEIRKELGF